MSVLFGLIIIVCALMGYWPLGVIIVMLLIPLLAQKISYPMWHVEPKFAFDVWSWVISTRSNGYGVQVGWFSYTWITFRQEW